MAILKILQYPDLRLRRKGSLVTNVNDPFIKKTIEDMVETLLKQENCAGLAATQLEIENPPRISVINYAKSTDKKNVLCLINPIITEREGNTINEEGCMSIKDIFAKIKRANKIKVQTLDLNGNQTTFEATGFFACCIQHECDHLDGILCIDHVSKLKRVFLEKKIAKLAKPG